MLRSFLFITLVFVFSPALAAEGTKLHVTGQAVVRAVPDQATILFEVVREGQSAEPLKRTVDEVVAKVIAAAEGLGIETRDIQATNTMVQPNYRHDRDTGEQSMEGITVRRSIEILVRSLEQYPKVVDAALSAGVNQMGQISLSLSDPAKAEEQAIREAVDDALAKARIAASQLDMTVDKISDVRVNAQQPGPMPLAMAAFRSGPEESFRQGEITIQAGAAMTVELVDN